MEITDELREQFPGMSDEDIGFYVGVATRNNQSNRQEYIQSFGATCADILKYFGYEGLKDYLNEATHYRGGRLSTEDFDTILKAAMANDAINQRDETVSMFAILGKAEQRKSILGRMTRTINRLRGVDDGDDM